MRYENGGKRLYLHKQNAICEHDVLEISLFVFEDVEKYNGERTVEISNC